jgi:hypothetical protein
MSATPAESPVPQLSWKQALAWRVRRHHLAERAPHECWLDVIRCIGGLHAQLMSSAELSVWARVDGIERREIDRAVWQDRQLIKTWAMRGTLHLLPADEYLLWQTAFASFRQYLAPNWLRYFEVTTSDLDQIVAAVDSALRDRMLTRDELADAVGRITGSAVLGDKLRQSWGSLLKPACFLGHLCFAPGQGQKVRFTSPKTWLSNPPAAAAHEPMIEITRRYLGAYGPATTEDFARWWGMSRAAAGVLIRQAGAVAVQIDGGPQAWLLPDDVEKVTSSTPVRSVRLLPAFDPYVIAASPHALRMMPGDFRKLIYRPQGWLSPVLLVDGRMEGIWRLERKRARLHVHVEPFAPLQRRAIKSIREEAERLAAFLGGTLELKL